MSRQRTVASMSGRQRRGLHHVVVVRGRGAERRKTREPRRWTARPCAWAPVVAGVASGAPHAPKAPKNATHINNINTLTYADREVPKVFLLGGGDVGGVVGGASRRDVPCAAPIGACGLSRRDRRWTLPWPRPTTSCFESASGASACGSRARASSARTGCSASRSTRSGKARCVRAACGCTGCSASRSTRSGKARWRWCAQVRPRGVAVSLQRGEEVCDGSNKFISTGRRPADCDQSTRDAAAKAIAEASAGPPKTQPDHLSYPHTPPPPPQPPRPKPTRGRRSRRRPRSAPDVRPPRLMSPSTASRRRTTLRELCVRRHSRVRAERQNLLGGGHRARSPGCRRTRDLHR